MSRTPFIYQMHTFICHLPNWFLGHFKLFFATARRPFPRLLTSRRSWRQPQRRPQTTHKRNWRMQTSGWNTPTSVLESREGMASRRNGISVDHNKYKLQNVQKMKYRINNNDSVPLLMHRQFFSERTALQLEIWWDAQTDCLRQNISKDHKSDDWCIWIWINNHVFAK